MVLFAYFIEFETSKKIQPGIPINPDNQMLLQRFRILNKLK